MSPDVSGISNLATVMIGVDSGFSAESFLKESSINNETTGDVKRKIGAATPQNTRTNVNQKVEQKAQVAE